MKPVLLCLLSLLLLTTACARRSPGTATVPPAAMTIPTTYVSPNMPEGANYPAIATWTMYPLVLNPNPARAGQPVEVWTDIYMVDFLITFVIARLEVNGVVVDQARWMLYIDQVDSHCLTYTPPAPGTYHITITTNLEENEAFYGQSGQQMELSASAVLTVA
jgi:hypothetical protein